MKITYESPNYTPERVTGRYVRCEGRKCAYRFIVSETESRFGRPGDGPTIREYITDGSELPEEFRNRCIKSKMTEHWQ